MKFKKIWFRFHVDWFLYHFYNAFKFVVDLVRKLARSTCNTLCNNNLQAGLRSVGWNITTLKRIDVFKTKISNLLALNSIRMGGSLNSTWKKNPSCVVNLYTHVYEKKFFWIQHNHLWVYFQLKLIVERNILGNICIFYPW